jgi:SAM-dependent methyltransferase
MELENVNCDICGSSKYTCLFEARDYRFGYKEDYSFVKCNDCGLIYINPRPNAESITELYESCYTPGDRAIRIPSEETVRRKKGLKRFWHKINGDYRDEIIEKAEGKVLDIGCGNGHLLVLLKDKGCDVYGVETNHKSASACNQRGFKVFCGILEDANFPDEFFDAVILSQVIEHLPSPKRTLHEIHRILKQDGKVLIYCPNADSYLSKIFGRYWHGWHIPFHFYGFTRDTIQKLSHRSGFKLEAVETVTPDNFFTVSLKSYLWGDKEGDTRPKEQGRVFDSLFFRACISLLFRPLDFVVRDKGDCLKVQVRKRATWNDET